MVFSQGVQDRFVRHVSDSGLIPEGSVVLVGYSGGADSTCLLHLLHATSFSVVGAYLNHRMRPEASEELAHCRSFCQTLDIPFLAGEADVPAIAKREKIGIEEAGRLARYEFFSSAKHQVGCNLIATAHTATDQAETVIWNLVRGSGTSGAVGIPEIRGDIIRPLLPFFRPETEAYCRSQGLDYRTDSGNFDESFSRVRIRNRVMPELRELNSRAAEHLVEFAQGLSQEDRYLNSLAAAALERSELALNGSLNFLTYDCEVAFDRSRLIEFPEVLVKRGLRLAAKALGCPLSRTQIMTLVGFLQSGEDGSQTAEGGKLVAEIDGSIVSVRNLALTLPQSFELKVPSQVESKEFGWRFDAMFGEPELQVRESTKAILNPDRVQGALWVRTAEPGDEIQPLGFDGTRKVSDFLSEFGLTRLARKRLPIVFDEAGPVWIPHVCLSNRVQLQVGARKAIHVHFDRFRDSK